MLLDELSIRRSHDHGRRVQHWCRRINLLSHNQPRDEPQGMLHVPHLPFLGPRAAGLGSGSEPRPGEEQLRTPSSRGKNIKSITPSFAASHPCHLPPLLRCLGRSYWP